MHPSFDKGLCAFMKCSLSVFLPCIWRREAGALESELFSVCGREQNQQGIISDRLRL